MFWTVHVHGNSTTITPHQCLTFPFLKAVIWPSRLDLFCSLFSWGCTLQNVRFHAILYNSCLIVWDLMDFMHHLLVIFHFLYTLPSCLTFALFLNQHPFALTVTTFVLILHVHHWPTLVSSNIISLTQATPPHSSSILLLHPIPDADQYLPHVCAPYHIPFHPSDLPAFEDPLPAEQPHQQTPKLAQAQGKAKERGGTRHDPKIQKLAHAWVWGLSLVCLAVSYGCHLKWMEKQFLDGVILVSSHWINQLAVWPWWWLNGNTLVLFVVLWNVSIENHSFASAWYISRDLMHCVRCACACLWIHAGMTNDIITTNNNNPISKWPLI